MAKSELSSLEQEVDNFLETFEQLSVENGSLQRKIDHLSNERMNLLNNKKKAAEHLRKIISQIQDELSCKIQV